MSEVTDELSKLGVSARFNRILEEGKKPVGEDNLRRVFEASSASESPAETKPEDVETQVPQVAVPKTSLTLGQGAEAVAAVVVAASETAEALSSKKQDKEAIEDYEMDKERAKEKTEKLLPKEPFQEIVDELTNLVVHPNGIREKELRSKLQQYVRVAKGENLQLLSRLKGDMEKAIKDPILHARKYIENVNVDEMEDEASHIVGYSEKFRGIITAYRDGAIRNIDLAIGRAQGRSTSQLERQISLLNWGTPPPGLDASADRYVQAEEEKRMTRLAPPTTPAPAPVAAPPPNLAEAFGLLDPEEIRQNLRAREKSMAPLVGPAEDLLKSLSFLKGAERTKEAIEEWYARAQLSAACATKLAAAGPEDLSMNKEAMGISNRQFEVLLGIRGVLEAKSLESHFIWEKTRGLFKEKKDFQLKSWAEGFCDDDLVEKCPNTIFDIKNMNDLEAFREVKISWLMQNLGLNREEAEDAEVVSRNLTFLANELEDGDTKYKSDGTNLMPDNRKAAPPLDGVKSMAAWQMMHPQERLEGKTAGGEAWSVFGVWAENKYRKNQLHIDPTRLQIQWNPKLRQPRTWFKVGASIRPPRSLWSPSSMQIFPTRLVSNAYEYYQDNSKRTLGEIFKENGKKLVNGNAFIEEPDFEGKVSEGVFKGYSFLWLSPAASVFKVLAKPGEFKNDWVSLRDNLKSLGVHKYYRNMLVLGLLGIDTRSGELKPKGNVSLAGAWASINKSAPGFLD